MSKKICQERIQELTTELMYYQDLIRGLELGHRHNDDVADELKIERKWRDIVLELQVEIRTIKSFLA